MQVWNANGRMLNIFNNTEHNTKIKGMKLIAYAIRSLGD